MNYHYMKCSYLIKQIAKKYESEIPLEELIAEGNLVYARCMKHYKVNKGFFDTYFNSSVYKALKDYAETFSKQLKLVKHFQEVGAL